MILLKSPPTASRSWIVTIQTVIQTMMSYSSIMRSNVRRNTTKLKPTIWISLGSNRSDTVIRRKKNWVRQGTIGIGKQHSLPFLQDMKTNIDIVSVCQILSIPEP